MNVICINNEISNTLDTALTNQQIPSLVKGKLYHVKDLEVIHGKMSVSLMEIPQIFYNKLFPLGTEIYWNLERFSYEESELEMFLSEDVKLN